MAIALSRPNDARARPSTVLQKSYREVFSKGYQPELYLCCARLMKRVESYLQTKNLARTTQNNIEFHVAMYAGALVLKLHGPHREKVKDMKLDELTDAVLQEAYDAVYKEYRRIGATDQTAKGPQFVERLMKKLRAKFAHAR